MLLLMGLSLQAQEGLLRNDTLPVLMQVKEGDTSYPDDQVEDRFGLNEKEPENKDHSFLHQDSGQVRFGRHWIELSKFTPFKNQSILQSLSFPDSLSYVAMVKVRKGDYRDTIDLKGRRPSPKSILSLQQQWRKANHIPMGAENEDGFGSDCPPGDCSHYFFAVDKKGKLIKADREGSAKLLIPKVKTPEDALFAIHMNDHYARGKYADTGDGFLILANENISHCPIRYADVLYYVNQHGSISVLGKILSQTTNLCY